MAWYGLYGKDPYEGSTVGQQGILRSLLRRAADSPYGGLVPGEEIPRTLPPAGAGPAPVQPLMTKDDLEQSQQGNLFQDRGAIYPPGMSREGLAERTNRESAARLLPVEEQVGAGGVGGPSPGSHIRFSVPGMIPGSALGGGAGPMFGMTPMTDYTSETSPYFAYAGQGGLGTIPGATPGIVGAQGKPGGGAFTPSSTPVIGRTAMGNPEFDWSGVANPEAFDAYTQPIRDAAMAADRARLEKIAADPMWEEKERARIWAEAQGRAQEGIRDALIRSMTKEAQRIRDEVMADPTIPPEKKLEEIQSRLNELSMFGSGVRPATIGGFPNE